MIFVFVLYALFASVFTIAKYGLDYTAPFFLVGTRMMLAGVFILSYQAIKKPESIKLKKQDILPLLKLAIFNIYLTNTFEFWGLQYLTSFKTCFFYSLSPFISAIFAYFVLSEKLNFKKWAGLIVGFIGFGPILFAQSEGEAVARQLLIFSSAELSVLSAAVCSVYGWILLKYLVDNRGLSAMYANGVSMLIGGACALCHSYFTENWDPFPVTEYIPFFECTVALIVISNFICYNLYGHLLKRFSATFMSFAGFTTPIFTAIFGFLFLGEQVTLPFVVSVCTVFCGLSLFYFEELSTLARAKKVEV